MPDPSTIIMCGAGAVAVALAAASIGVGRVLLAADEASDRWPDAVVPDLSARQPAWMGMDLAAHADETLLSAPFVLRQSGGQIAELFTSRPHGKSMLTASPSTTSSSPTGARASLVIMDEFFQPTEQLSKRAARRARGKAAAARRVARQQAR